MHLALCQNLPIDIAGICARLAHMLELGSEVLGSGLMPDRPISLAVSERQSLPISKVPFRALAPQFAVPRWRRQKVRSQQ